MKNTIRENLLNLLRREAGGELPVGQNGTSLLAKKAGKLVSWAQRLLDDETDVRVSAVDEAARAFRLSPWQLLVPGLNIDAPQALADEREWSFEGVDRERFLSLTGRQKGQIEAAMLQALDAIEVRTGNRLIA